MVHVAARHRTPGPYCRFGAGAPFVGGEKIPPIHGELGVMG